MDSEWISFATTRFLYAASFLDAAHERDGNLAGVLAEIRRRYGEDIFEYPDGSLEVQGEFALKAFEESILEPIAKRANDLATMSNSLDTSTNIGCTWYDSLCYFPPQQKVILRFWGDFTKKLPAGQIVVRTAIDVNGNGDPDVTVDSVPVTIVFHKKITDALGSQLAETFAQWARDDCISGESPPRLLSDAVDVTHKVARIQVDLTGSGQRLANWLILKLLHGADVYPFTEICFVSKPHPDETFEEKYGLTRYESQRYTFNAST